MLYFIVVATIAPIRKLAELKETVISDSVFNQKNQWVLESDEAITLFKQKAFIEAQIKLADSDSIGLVINLKDSTVTLVIKGVSIHVSKIEKMKIDRFFKAVHPLVYAKLFSVPLFMTSENTSIVKEPIVIRKAPKDTIEAMATALVPQMPKQNPACFEINLPNDFSVLLIQNELLTKEDRQVVRKFKAEQRERNWKDNFKSVVHLKQVCYSPSITLWLDANEIRSIYRALPTRPAIVINY